ncbi:MAG: hypothetical protein ACYSO1_05290 [Planctomycetota bacterium]|jgi:hypothetical protein
MLKENCNDIMKKSFSEHLMNAALRFLFFGYAVAFAAWWYISPKGFSVGHLRFWSNNIIPIIIVLASLICWIGVFRSRRSLLSVLMPSYPVATLGFIIAGMVLYPVSMRPIFLIPLLCWLAVLVILTFFTVKHHPITKPRWIPTVLLVGLSVLMGAALPWSQQSWEPATKPLNPEKVLNSNLPLNPSQSPFQLSNQVTVFPRYAEIMINDLKTQLNISPLLTFYSCSPDRCWILLSPHQERMGTKHIFKGMRRTQDGLYLEYNDTERSTLEITSPDNERYVELDVSCEILNPVYSHLNTFTEFAVKGKEKIFVSFSPCPDKRIEVTAFDYPFGRPARLAYLDESEMFRVVQAKSAEKGPFTTLAEGKLLEEQPLELTIYDGDSPIYRIIFEDWATQNSKQLSPTAGWGLPENAIEFSLDGENPNQATFFVTLASTSTGRGFDSVGHNAGVYRNRIRIEQLNNSE